MQSSRVVSTQWRFVCWRSLEAGDVANVTVAVTVAVMIGWCSPESVKGSGVLKFPKSVPPTR